MELLERDDVLQGLMGLVERARDGHGNVALLRGEAGIGKTSVATALASAVATDAHVLWGWCDDLLAARPLGPVWDMAASEPTLAEALQADDRGAARQAVLDVFTRSHRPTVAVVEDVHWADGATLDLLTLVGRRIAHTHTLLVLTFREVPPGHPLGVVLGDLPSARVASFRLQPLSPRAVATLVDDHDVASRVFARTDGNPLFVSAVLSNPHDRVPATVSDLTRSLTARLTGTAERLVQLVSVVPGHAELALLDAIDPALVDAVEAAEHLDLLRMDGQAVAFRHELVRTAVEAALAEPRRRELHRQVLAAGETLRLDPARLAHHARLAQDVEAMLRWLPDAAERAAAELSHREALAHLEALAPHLHRLPLEQRADLQALWAAEEEFSDGRGLRQALAAVELRRQAGDVAGVGAGLVQASRSAWAGGDFGRAAELAAEAVEVLRDVGGEGLALAYAQLARGAAQSYDLDLAQRHSEQALALAPEPSHARALALTTGGVVRNLVAYPAGSPMLVEAAGIAESLGLPWELQRASANLIETALFAKDVALARRRNEAFLETMDADVGTAAWHVIMRATIETAAGTYEAAEPALRDLLGRPELVVSLRWLAEGALAELLVRRGDAEAGPTVDRLWDRAHAHGQVQDRVWAGTVSAESLWVFRRRDDLATERNLGVLAEVAERAPRWALGELALWLWLDGHLASLPDRAPEPLRWLEDGCWDRAAQWFADRGVPFEQAVALSAGNTDARLEALAIAQRIGARALAARLRDDLVTAGVTGIPRGPRRTTRANPFGLTARQSEVLSLLVDGRSNAEIADRLFISLRTVENHVSAILAALGVTTREEAARVATEDDPG